MELKSLNREKSVDRLKQLSPLSQLFKANSCRLVASPRFFRRRHRGARHTITQSAPHTQVLSCTDKRLHLAEVHDTLDSTAPWSNHSPQAGLTATFPRLNHTCEAWHYNGTVVRQVVQPNNGVLTLSSGAEQQGKDVDARQGASTDGHSHYAYRRQQHISLNSGKVHDPGVGRDQGEEEELTSEEAAAHVRPAQSENSAASGNDGAAQKLSAPASNPVAAREPSGVTPAICLRKEHGKADDEYPEETAGREQAQTGLEQARTRQVTLLSSQESSAAEAAWTTVGIRRPPAIATTKEDRHAAECDRVGRRSAKCSRTGAGEKMTEGLQAPGSSLSLKAHSAVDVSAYTRADTSKNRRSAVVSDENGALNSKNGYGFIRDVTPTKSPLLSVCASSATSSSFNTQQLSDAVPNPPDSAALPLYRNGDVVAFTSCNRRSTSTARIRRRRTAEEAAACCTASRRVNTSEGDVGESKTEETFTASLRNPQNRYDRPTTVDTARASYRSGRTAALDSDGTTETAADSSCVRSSEESERWFKRALTRVLQALSIDKTTRAASETINNSSRSSIYSKSTLWASLQMSGSDSRSRSCSMSSNSVPSSEDSDCDARGGNRGAGALRDKTTSDMKSGKRRSSKDMHPTSPLRKDSVCCCCCCDCCSSSIVVTTESVPPSGCQQVLLYPVPPNPLTFYDSQGKRMSGNPGWYGHNYPYFRRTRIQKYGFLYWLWRRGQIRAGALFLLFLQEAIKQILLSIKVILFREIHTLQDGAPNRSTRQQQNPLSSSMQQQYKTGCDSRVLADSRMRDQWLVDIGAQQQQDLPHVCAAYACKGTSRVPSGAAKHCSASESSRKGDVNDSAGEQCRCIPFLTRQLRAQDYSGETDRGSRPVAARLHQRKRLREHGDARESLRFQQHHVAAGIRRELKGNTKRKRKERQRVEELLNPNTTGLSAQGVDAKDAGVAHAETVHHGGNSLCTEEAVGKRQQRNRLHSRERYACSRGAQLRMPRVSPEAALNAWRPDECQSDFGFKTFQGASNFRERRRREFGDLAYGNEAGEELWRNAKRELDGLLKMFPRFRGGMQRVRKTAGFFLHTCVRTRLHHRRFSLRHLSWSVALFPLNLFLKWRWSFLWMLFPVRLLLQLLHRLLRQYPLWLLPTGFMGFLQHQIPTAVGLSFLEGIVREWRNLHAPESDIRVRTLFVVLLLVMFPFVHGIYIPCLVLIWLVRQAYDACWWFCATHCCSYCTSDQQLRRWRKQTHKQQRAPQQQVLQQGQSRQQHQGHHPRYDKHADVAHGKRQQQRLQEKPQNNSSRARQQGRQVQKMMRHTQQCGLQPCEQQSRSGPQGQPHRERSTEHEAQRRQQMQPHDRQERETAQQRPFEQQPTEWHHMVRQVLQWLYVLLLEFDWRHNKVSKGLPGREKSVGSHHVAAATRGSSHLHVFLRKEMPLLQAMRRCVSLLLYLPRTLVLGSSSLLFAFLPNDAANKRNQEVQGTLVEQVRLDRLLRRFVISAETFIRLLRRDPHKGKSEAIHASADTRDDVLCTARNAEENSRGRRMTCAMCADADNAGRLLNIVPWKLFLASISSRLPCVSRCLQEKAAAGVQLLCHPLRGLRSAVLRDRSMGQTGKPVNRCFSLANGFTKQEKRGKTRNNETEILSALSGQELVLFSQPHLVICGVGYTEKLTREDLLHVVQRKLLMPREMPGVNCNSKQEEDAAQTGHRIAATGRTRRGSRQIDVKGSRSHGRDKKEGMRQATEAEEEEEEEEGRLERDGTTGCLVEEKEKVKWRGHAETRRAEGHRCHTEENVAGNSNEDDALPLLCFKHPRLRTSVRRVLHRYCWVRDENFSAARHVVSLNRQQVLTLLALHEGQRSPADFQTFKGNLLRWQAGSTQACLSCCRGSHHREKKQAEEKDGKGTILLRRSRRVGRTLDEETGQNQNETEKKAESDQQEKAGTDRANSRWGSRNRSRKLQHSCTAGHTQALRSNQNEKEKSPAVVGPGNVFDYSSKDCRGNAAGLRSCSRQEGIYERSFVSNAPWHGWDTREQCDTEKKSSRYSFVRKPIKIMEDRGTPSGAGRCTGCSCRKTKEGQVTSVVETPCCYCTEPGPNCSCRRIFVGHSSSVSCSRDGRGKEGKRGQRRRKRPSVCCSSSRNREDREEVMCPRMRTSSEGCRKNVEKKERSFRRMCECVVRIEEAQALVTLLASQSLSPLLPLWQFVLLESVELPLPQPSTSEDRAIVSEQGETINCEQRLEGPRTRNIAETTAAAGAAVRTECRCDVTYGSECLEKQTRCTDLEEKAANSNTSGSNENESTVTTETRWKRESNCSVGQSVEDGKATSHTCWVLGRESVTAAGLQKNNAREKDEMSHRVQSPQCKQEKKVGASGGDARQKAAAKSDSGDLQSEIWFATSTPRRTAAKESRDIRQSDVAERGKGEWHIRGCASSGSLGMAGGSTQSCMYNSASRHQRDIPELQENRRSSSNIKKPRVGSMVVFRVHHAVADGIALTNMFLSDVFTASPSPQQSRQGPEHHEDLFLRHSAAAEPTLAASTSSAVIPVQDAAELPEQHILVDKRMTGARGTEEAEMERQRNGSPTGCKTTEEDQGQEESTRTQTQMLLQDMPTCTPSTTAASSPAASGRYFDGEPFHTRFSEASARPPPQQPTADESAGSVFPVSATEAAVSPTADPTAAEMPSAAVATSVAAISRLTAPASTQSFSAASVTPIAAASGLPADTATQTAAAAVVEASLPPHPSSDVAVVSVSAADTVCPVAGTPLPVPDAQHVPSIVRKSVLPEYCAKDKALLFRESRVSCYNPKALHQKAASSLTATVCDTRVCCPADGTASTATTTFDSKPGKKPVASQRSIKPLVPPIVQPALLPRMLMHIVAYLMIPWHVCSLLVLRRERNWDSLGQLRRQRSGWAHDIHWIHFDLQRLRKLRRSLAAAAAATSANASEQPLTQATRDDAIFSCPAFVFLCKLVLDMLNRSLSFPFWSLRGMLLPRMFIKSLLTRRCNTHRLLVYGCSAKASSRSPTDPNSGTAIAALSTAAAAESAGKCESACLDESAETAALSIVRKAAPERKFSVDVLQRVAQSVKEFVELCMKRNSGRKTSASSDRPPHIRLAAARNPFTINELLTSCVAGGICRYVRAKAKAKHSPVDTADPPKPQSCRFAGPTSRDVDPHACLPKQTTSVETLVVRRSPRPRHCSPDATCRDAGVSFSSRLARKPRGRSAAACGVDPVPDSVTADAPLPSARAMDRDSSSHRDSIRTRHRSTGSSSSYSRERCAARGRRQDKLAAISTGQPGCIARVTSSAGIQVWETASSSTAEDKPPAKKRSLNADTTSCPKEEEEGTRRKCISGAVRNRYMLCRTNDGDAVHQDRNRTSDHLAPGDKRGKEKGSAAAERRSFSNAEDRREACAVASEKRSVPQTGASGGETAEAAVVTEGIAKSLSPSATVVVNARYFTTVREPLFHKEPKRNRICKTKSRTLSGKVTEKKLRLNSDASAATPPQTVAAATDGTAGGVSDATAAAAPMFGPVPLQRKTHVLVMDVLGSAASRSVTDTYSEKNLEAPVRHALPGDNNEKCVCSGPGLGFSRSETTHLCRASATTRMPDAQEERQLIENLPCIPEGLHQTQQLLLHLNIVVPVNLRTTEEESFQLRNSFTSAVVQLTPADLFSAITAYERLVKVRTRLRRSVRSLGACVFGMMEKICFATTPDFTWFLHMWLTNKLSMLLSNVPGPSELPQIYGRQVYTMHFVGSLVGKVGINASAFSYANNLDLVLHIDRGVVDSPELLRQCILDEYRELERLCASASSSKEQAFGDC